MDVNANGTIKFKEVGVYKFGISINGIYGGAGTYVSDVLLEVKANGSNIYTRSMHNSHDIGQIRANAFFSKCVVVNDLATEYGIYFKNILPDGGINLVVGDLHLTITKVN